MTPCAESVAPKHKRKFARVNLGHGDGVWKLSGTKAKPNAWLTGTGSRRLEGTNSGHKNAEGMPAVGVRVEPPVRLVHEVEMGGVT